MSEPNRTGQLSPLNLTARRLARRALRGNSPQLARLVHGVRARRAPPARLTIVLYHLVTEAAHPLGSAGHCPIRPSEFRRHLDFLARHYQLIDLRQLDQLEAPRGEQRPLAAVCFDDGYRCVLEEALPELRATGTPATLFVTTSTLGNADLGWRDKIRLIASNGSAARFLAFLQGPGGDGSVHTEGLAPDTLRKWSRDPARIVSLTGLRTAIDRFLEDAEGVDTRAMAEQIGLYCSADDIIDDPLLAFGNHTATHPILPMLTTDEQIAELAPGRALLAERGVTDVGVACPFDPFDDGTLAACRALGYRHLFQARGGSNRLPLLPLQIEHGDCGIDDAPVVLNRKLALGELVPFANGLGSS